LGNRIHVAPPLNINDGDALTGLAILDEALAAADTLRREPPLVTRSPS